MNSNHQTVIVMGNSFMTLLMMFLFLIVVVVTLGGAEVSCCIHCGHFPAA